MNAKINRVYLNNLKCFKNFEFKIDGRSPLLVIGKNGTGKSTLLDALEMLKMIARGCSVKQVFGMASDSGGFEPMRIEIEFCIGVRVYVYGVAVLPDASTKEFAILQEDVACNGATFFHRDHGQIALAAATGDAMMNFQLDVKVFALAAIQAQSNDDPVVTVRRFLADLFILQPIPQLMQDVIDPTSGLLVKTTATIASWLSYVFAKWPAAYGVVDKYLKLVMPDFVSLQTVGEDFAPKRYVMQFQRDADITSIPISSLSNGEKCQLLAAALMAVNSINGGIVCFWDEPTNYLSINEVGPMMRKLKSVFAVKGQLIVTAHSDEAILSFEDDSTFVFCRKSHLEPTLPPRTLEQLRERKLLSGDLSTALRLGEVGDGM